MKKLLSMLAAVGLTATAGASVVACGQNTLHGNGDGGNTGGGSHSGGGDKTPSLGATGKYTASSKTITISGTNLGTNSDVKSSVSVSGVDGAAVASASTSDTTLTVVLTTDISTTIDTGKTGTLKVEYKPNGSDLTADITINGSKAVVTKAVIANAGTYADGKITAALTTPGTLTGDQLTAAIANMTLTIGSKAEASGIASAAIDNGNIVFTLSDAAKTDADALATDKSMTIAITGDANITDVTITTPGTATAPKTDAAYVIPTNVVMDFIK